MRVLPITPQYNRNNVSSARKAAPPLACNDVSFEAHLPHLHLKEKCKKSLFSLDMSISSWLNCYAARHANSVLDDRYGKGNYTVMVVGRSMASVGETMRLMGRDVRFLPLSGLTFGLDCNIAHIDVYRNYLRSIGLTKDIIAQNPEHKFLLIDYACTGNSLKMPKVF